MIKVATFQMVSNNNTGFRRGPGQEVRICIP